MRKLYYIATCVLCLQLLGVPWIMLQCVAWTNMTIHYSQEGGFAQGLSKTFDGQHPCPLCQAVHRGVKKETTNFFNLTNLKMQVFPSSKSRWVYSTLQMESSLSLNSFPYTLRHDEPPVPPPRVGHVATI